MDREKVIKGIHQHCEGSMFDRCGECPYYEFANEPFVCRDMLLNDLSELLKEQEAPSKEELISHYGKMYKCKRCGLEWYQQTQKYCQECGKAVKWDE